MDSPKRPMDPYDAYILGFVFIMGLVLGFGIAGLFGLVGR